MSAGEISELVGWLLLWLVNAWLWVRVGRLETKKEPTLGDMTRNTRDALQAYREAGFTDDQAKELVREAMRTVLKQNGGWTA